MRTIIYGAGGIGSIVGGHLARTGHEVVLIGRPGHVDAINAKGLTLITPAGTYNVKVPAVTSPDQIQFRPDDVVFLTMKSQNTEDALKALKKCTDEAAIFCLQNGVRNEETASRIFKNVYGVTVRIGAIFINNGEVTARMDPAGWLIMGRYPDGTDELVESVGKQCSEANLVIKVVPNIMRYKWGKTMNNIRSAVGAITNEGRAECSELQAMARKEFQDLLNEAGIDYAEDSQINQQWPEFNVRSPQYASGDAQSSTWQSLAKKTGSVENEYFNGEVVRLARKLGKHAPINEGLNRIMQQMAAHGEVPGKFTVAQLKNILLNDSAPQTK